MTEFDQGSLFNDLGRRYEHGDGVAQSDAEALSWYLEACKHGNVAAMHSTGLFFELGRGARSSTRRAAVF